MPLRPLGGGGGGGGLGTRLRLAVVVLGRVGACWVAELGKGWWWCEGSRCQSSDTRTRARTHTQDVNLHSLRFPNITQPHTVKCTRLPARTRFPPLPLPPPAHPLGPGRRRLPVQAQPQVPGPPHQPQPRPARRLPQRLLARLLRAQGHGGRRHVGIAAAAAAVVVVGGGETRDGAGVGSGRGDISWLVKKK